MQGFPAASRDGQAAEKGCSSFSIWMCETGFAAGGMILGDLPPTEAFPLGGTNSVRGYAEGAVGSARNFVTSHAELRCPLSGPFEVSLATYLLNRSEMVGRLRRS